MTLKTPALFVAALAFGAVVLTGADWPQWRGPHRNGVAASSPEMIDKLPEQGLAPLWVSEAEIPSAGRGGWGSPIASGDKVFLFAHEKQKGSNEELPPRKFPWLPPEKRVGMTDEEYAEYERNRRDEDQARSNTIPFYGGALLHPCRHRRDDLAPRVWVGPLGLFVALGSRTRKRVPRERQWPSLLAIEKRPDLLRSYKELA